MNQLVLLELFSLLLTMQRAFVGLLSAIKQWVFSARENRLNATPITATKKLAETATHKTASGGLFATSLRDTDASHFFIVTENGTESASFWIGLFIA